MKDISNPCQESQKLLSPGGWLDSSVFVDFFHVSRQSSCVLESVFQAESKPGCAAFLDTVKMWWNEWQLVREQIIPTHSCRAETYPHLHVMLNQVLPKPFIKGLCIFLGNSESVSQPCFTCPECKYPSFEFWTQPAQSEVNPLLHCGAWDQVQILVCTNLSKERSLITGSSS